MKTVKCGLMIPLVLLLGSAVAAPVRAIAPPATPEGVMKRVEAAEEALADVQMFFTQTTRLKATADQQELTGELMMLKSPERFQVRFTSPVRQIVHYDGSHLILYFPETGQAFRQPAKPEELTALLGINPAAVVKNFRKGYHASLLGCGTERCRLSFADPARPALLWNITVSTSTWALEEASFEDDEIQVVLKCYDYRVNRSLTPSSLRLNLPSDVEIYDGLPKLFGRGRDTVTEP